MNTNLTLIAIGSNLTHNQHQPDEIVHLAIARLFALFSPYKSSKIYQSEAVPAGSGPDFVNAVVAVWSSYSPEATLQMLHNIEAEFQRERPHRWAPRTLDLDLVAFGELILPNEMIWQKWAELPIERAQIDAPSELILPHPRAHQRAFVLKPILDIEENWVHPVIKKTARRLYENLPESDKLGLKNISQ